MFAYKMTAIATIVMSLLMFWFAGRVGQLRSKLQIKAPAMTGDPAFERAVRVQANTNEQALMMLPALWLFAVTVSDLYAGAAGLAWCLGRALYAIAYWEDATKRSMGFLIGFIAWIVCAVGTLYGLFMV